MQTIRLLHPVLRGKLVPQNPITGSGINTGNRELPFPRALSMKKMKTDYLQQQNILAGALLAKLERIKELWDEISSELDLGDLAEAAHSIASSLEQARATWLSDDFPSDLAMQELRKDASEIASMVEKAARTLNATDLATGDDLGPIVDKTG
jgi:hypothetical protein